VRWARARREMVMEGKAVLFKGNLLLSMFFDISSGEINDPAIKLSWSV
jgi:hypothetical protein